LQIQEELQLKGKRPNVIPGYYDGEYFNLCEKFAPGMISPLGFANSFIVVDGEKRALFEKESSIDVVATRFRLASETFKSFINR